MKKILFSLLLFGLIINLSAQELAKSTLWKIEGNELTSASYLFGTIHITCNANLEGKIDTALKNTEQLVLELDFDDPQLQANMMQSIMMKEDSKISDFLSEEDYKILDEFLTKELGMGLTMMNQMKPFFIQASLYPKLIDCPMQSYELQLVETSKAQNEEVFGLETVQEQMQVFDDIPYEDQLKDLVKMAKDNMAKDKTLFAEMVEIYESEDIEAMLDMTGDEDYSTISQHQDLLLENRNKNWISKIESYAKDKPTFFGVGAAHLAGNNGVIQLLRDKGYQVTPVY
ncbi:MAG: TraB/GumN family protein [Bacteroidota bacterium]